MMNAFKCNAGPPVFLEDGALNDVHTSADYYSVANLENEPFQLSH